MKNDEAAAAENDGVRAEQMFQVGILDLATGLVNAVDGSGPPSTREELDESAAYLEGRLRKWKPSTTPLSRARDAAARSYVEASLAEFYARRSP